MSLAKVLEELKQVSQFANEDVESGPRETLVGRRGRKNQAIERLKTLKFEYQASLMESAAFIVVTGEKSKEFTSVAVENFKCFSANPNDFYEELAGRIPPTLYQGKESVSNLFDILGRHLEDKAQELGIIGYPQMTFKQQYRVTIKNKNDLVDLVRQAINDQVGSEIVGLQAINSLTDEAISKNHSGKTTPVILETANEALALDLVKTLNRLKPKGVFLVVSGRGTKNLKAVNGMIAVKDPTNENVEKALTSISTFTKNN